jgi:CRISPR/Cas system-associated exonuclease Cas4 (RecB family)
MWLGIMGKEIVANLKFKKVTGNFDPSAFAKMLDDAYLATKRPDQKQTKNSFSPSSLGYGSGNCPRYWYLAFSGAMFIDNNNSQAIANMSQGTQAHERIQGIIKKMGVLKHEELEIINEYPPVRGFIDVVLDWNNEEVIGEIKTAKQENWDSHQAKMSPSANHLLQILTYMKLKDVKEGFFLYENKNTQEILIIPVQMNDKNKKIIEELFGWMCLVYDNFISGELPLRPFIKSSSACKNCKIKKDCWSGEIGSVDIAAYEPPKL